MSRIFRWTIAAAMVTAASLAGPPANAAPGEPVAFVKALYGLPDLWLSVVSTPEGRSRYLTPQLIPLVGSNFTGVFKDRLAVDPLAYDPVADIGEMPLLSDETFTLIGSDASGTTVKVDFKNHSRPDTVTIKLVGSESGDRWLLSDIAFADGKTLLTLFKYM